MLVSFEPRYCYWRLLTSLVALISFRRVNIVSVFYLYDNKVFDC